MREDRKPQSSKISAGMAGAKDEGSRRRPIRQSALAYALPILLTDDAFAHKGPTRFSSTWRETHNRAPCLEGHIKGLASREWRESGKRLANARRSQRSPNESQGHPNSTSEHVEAPRNLENQERKSGNYGPQLQALRQPPGFSGRHRSASLPQYVAPGPQGPPRLNMPLWKKCPAACPSNILIMEGMQVGQRPHRSPDPSLKFDPRSGRSVPGKRGSQLT